jgi:hypothetical protein
MPSDFPRSPWLMKGALVIFETKAPVPTNIIVFQYNPESVARSFEQPAPDRPAWSSWFSSGDTRRVLMAPIESFRMTIELDAADQLEFPATHPITVASGLHPTLAALELLLYPSSSAVILKKAMARAGAAFVLPAEAPLVLLVWGPLRVVPVRVSSLNITEQAFDNLLNPIQANVDLDLRTLTEKELDKAGVPFSTLAISQHIAKEVLARSNTVNSVEQMISMLPF